MNVRCVCFVLGILAVFSKPIVSQDEASSKTNLNRNITLETSQNTVAPFLQNGKERGFNGTSEVINGPINEESHHQTFMKDNSTNGSSEIKGTEQNVNRTQVTQNEKANGEVESNSDYNNASNEAASVQNNMKNITVPLKEMENDVFSTFILNPVPSCNCSNNNSNYCQCTSRGGVINSNLGMTGFYIYNIPIKSGEKLMIYLQKNEADLSNSENCSLVIGDEIFNKTNLLNQETIIISQRSLNITEQNTNDCYWSLSYRIGTQYNDSSEEFDLEGSLRVPSDPDCLQLYRPMTRKLWNIVPAVANCSIEVTVEGLDLGSSSLNWDGSKGSENETKADFLAIGSGKLLINESVSLKDTVLYGRSESSLTFTFDECEAHVMFVADLHYQNATGFTVNYKVVEEKFFEKHEPIIADKKHKEGQTISFVIVNLNGIDLNNANVSRKFQKSMATLAYNFIKKQKLDHLVLRNSSLIVEDDILINDIHVCQILYCSVKCVAFNFSVNVKSTDGHWLFTDERLIEMFRVQNLKDSWIGEETIEVCELEIDMEVSWRWIGFGGIVMIMIIIVIISLAYKVTEAIYNESNILAKNARDGPISYLNTSSPAPSSNSSRFTLPTRGRKNEQNNQREPSEWSYNISGFEQFDPVGERVDPRTCGLDEEVVHDGNSVTFYSNSAFDADEHELFSQAVLRRSQTPRNDNTASNNRQSHNDAYSSDESEIGDYDRRD